MPLSNPILGCAAALVSSAAWALDPILFRRLGDSMGPTAMNLAKGVIGVLLLCLPLIYFGMGPVDTRTFLLLGISGILGIALADTFFFMALMRLGARLAILIEPLCAVVTVILAVLLLGERPAAMVWVGIVLTIAGVGWVLWEREPRKELQQNWASGIKFGMLSVLFTALGIIVAKLCMESIAPLEATIVRLAVGTAALGLWGLVTANLRRWLSPLRQPAVLANFTLAVFVAICVGLFLSFVALKYVDAAVAVPLNSTSALFVLPMEAFAAKTRISMRAVVGAVVATCGIIIIFLING